jgi:hypothetical protein
MLLVPASLVGAEEAVLPTGQTLRGKLKLTNGRLFFTPSRRRAALRLDQVDHVRFPLIKRFPSRVATLHRVTLIDGQRLTGEILRLDAEALRFRPTWAGVLTIPRHVIVSLMQLPGYANFVDEDFETECKAWKMTGLPALSDRQHTSGKRSLLMKSPGQFAEYSLAEPLEAGRAGINFHDPLVTTASRWLFEANFQSARGTRVIRIVVGDASDSYTAELPGEKQASFRVRRTAGWHRLQLEFTGTMLVISVDDDLLWAGREHGPGGPLCKIRLACRPVPAKGKQQGEVFFDDFALARVVEPGRHSRADPDQDELWLRDGDQVFGRVLTADRRSICLRARFGKRIWVWGDVRGLYLREAISPSRITEGEQVRIRVRTGAGPELDRVVGQVRGLDADRLTVRAPILGELVIDRHRVRRLRWLFHGRRIELDHTGHHLGPKGMLVARLHPARAEGLKANWKFDLESLPAAAQLQLQVAHLRGKEDGNTQAWKRGELQTEVVVNGKVVDYLNHHVQHSGWEPRRVSIALPRERLRVGRNTLQLRQTPERRTGHYESFGVKNLVIEMPR